MPFHKYLKKYKENIINRMDHQDWNQYIFTSKPSNDKGYQKKPKSTESKLEKNVEEGKMTHKKFDSEYGKYVQKNRLSRGMTQKDLAQKLNVQVKDINDIESSNGKYNGQLVNKINRIFNVKKKN